jgi:Flp pilus assembly CpaF family ATPase
MAELLAKLVHARANFLVAGETGAGKTTFLRSLTDLFDPAERVGVVEDTAELDLDNRNRFNLETLHPHDIAAGDAENRLLDVGDLVANALRMRPDRLVVGEVRLPKEAFYTLQALHTGHDGSATTVHASSAEDALFRIELLARQSMHDLSLADHEPVGAHPERIGHQIAYVEQAVLSVTGGDVVRMERFEIEAIAVVEVKLGCVLDNADTLGRVEEVG